MIPGIPPDIDSRHSPFRLSGQARYAWAWRGEVGFATAGIGKVWIAMQHRVRSLRRRPIVIDHSETHVPPGRKTLAERRMAEFDRYPRELRDILNGIGDNPDAARGFLARGVRTTRDAEDLRARIGLERAEAAAAMRTDDLGARVADGFKRFLRREPAVDRGAARAQAQRILRGMAS